MSEKAEALALVLHVGDDAYAVACRDVISVVPRPRLRVVPGAPRDVLGVFVFRGSLVPVIDLALHLSTEPTPDRLSSRVVLVRPGGRTIGVLAAHVSDVVRLTRDVDHATMRSSPAMKSVALHDGRAVVWLEPKALVPESVIELLEGAP